MGALEAAKALSYEVGFVVVPGVVVFVAVDRRSRSWIATFGLGWALGYALEIAAFTATAATGYRSLFLLYPPLAVVLAAPALWRRATSTDSAAVSVGQPRPFSRLTTGVGVTLVAGCVLTLTYVAFEAFSVSPLPDSVQGVSYYIDQVFDISLTAELMHHFPPTYPWVAGTPLAYHWLAFAHMAGMAQVTGLEPSLVVLRIAPLLMLTVAFVLAFVAGSTLSRSTRVGALGVAMLFLTGEVDLSPDWWTVEPFLGTFRENLWQSPTFLLGLVFFLAALTLLWEVVDPRTVPSRRAWILLAPMLLAAGGSKGPVLPVLLGGLVIYGGWRLLEVRRLDRRIIGACSLVAASAVIAIGIFYTGDTADPTVDPFLSFERSQFWREVVEPNHVLSLLTPLAWMLAAAALFAPLAGIMFLLARHKRPVTQSQRLLLALLIVSVVGFVVVDFPGVSQLYVLHYGYAAGVLLSAWGVIDAWKMLDRESQLRRYLLIIAGVASLVLFRIILGVQRSRVDFDEHVGVVYGAFAVLGVIAMAAAWALGRRVRRVGAACATTALGLILGAAALDAPGDLWRKAGQGLDGESVYAFDTYDNRGLNAELLDGLRWVRAHTSPDEVLAVNNHYVNEEAGDSRYFYYSAFAERRVFLESWGGRSFPERWRLNQRVFRRGDLEAAAELRDRYGVTLLLVDRIHEPAGADLSVVGELVYENSAVAVYRLA